jgi:hypothetical protein
MSCDLCVCVCARALAVSRVVAVDVLCFGLSCFALSARSVVTRIRMVCDVVHRSLISLHAHAV